MANSRVSLDPAVNAFNRGETAAEVQDSFPSLTLADVHAAIAFYLNNKAEIDGYLARREKETTQLQAQYSTPGLREKC